MSTATADRAVFEATIKSIHTAQAKMAQFIADGSAHPGLPTCEHQAGVDSREPRPNLVDKAMRAHVALSDAKAALNEAFAAAGVRPA
jgi:hypothetical protein